VISCVADHHASSDRLGDPHSPHVDHALGWRGALRGLAHAHVGWLFLQTNAPRKSVTPATGSRTPSFASQPNIAHTPQASLGQRERIMSWSAAASASTRGHGLPEPAQKLNALTRRHAILGEDGPHLLHWHSSSPDLSHATTPPVSSECATRSASGVHRTLPRAHLGAVPRSG
jgi:hypothetical protein